MGDKNDLTQGTIWKKLLIFFLPIAAGTCIQQLYSAVDGLIVGRFVGTIALAAVGGSAAQLTNTIVNFFVALTGGASVIIAQFFGAGRIEDLKKASGNILAICVAVGIAVGAAVIAIAPWILQKLEVPAETMADSVTYVRICFLAMPVIVTLNMESNIVRALGDSRYPFIYMVASCISNIILDTVFVVTFGWGVAGVAIATVMAQCLNFVLITRRMLVTDKPYRLDLKTLKFRGSYLGRMLWVGIPSGFQSVMYGFSNIVVQSGINILGTVSVASWAMSTKVDGIFWAVTGAVGQAITTFIGQNYGAGKADRVRACVKQGFIMAEIITVIIMIAILGLGMPALEILTADTAVIELTYRLLWFFVPFYVFYMVIEVISGVLRGAGDSLNSLIITGLGICLFRIIWVFTMFRINRSIETISMCFGLSWVLTAALMFTYYKKGKWMKIKESKKETS